MTEAPVLPLVVAVAPNGARRGKTDHPRLPLTVNEIAYEAARCREEGAAMLHLHVRDAEGRHTLDADLYLQVIAAVRRAAGADFLIQITTEAVGRYGPAEQRAVVDAVAPEAVSLALRELAPDDADLGQVAAFLQRHARRGALIQYIVYDPADLARLTDLQARGVAPIQGASVIYVLGRYAAGQVSAPGDLLPFLAANSPLPWMVCAFGARERAALVAAIVFEGHARVGFENNLLRPDGSLAPDNASQVEALADLSRQLGRRVATSDEARRLLAGS